MSLILAKVDHEFQGCPWESCNLYEATVPWWRHTIIKMPSCETSLTCQVSDLWWLPAADKGQREEWWHSKKPKERETLNSLNLEMCGSLRDNNIKQHAKSLGQSCNWLCLLLNQVRLPYLGWNSYNRFHSIATFCLFRYFNFFPVEHCTAKRVTIGQQTLVVSLCQLDGYPVTPDPAGEPQSFSSSN